MTVDLDSGNLLELLKAYYNLRQLTDDVEVYSTRRGYHVVGYGLPFTQAEALKVREFLGDDSNRIFLDEVAAAGHNAKPLQILWTHKGGKASRHKIDIPSALY